MIRRLARRWLGLPRRRCASAVELEFVPMRDGVRLATYHVWPIDVAETPGTIVMRTPYGADGRSAIGLAARLLAESGYHVILQDVRGRYGSEGRFVPFVHERADGADTLRWIADQAWSTGPVGLFGASYLAYAAWAALAEAPEHVGALVSVIGSGDLYGTFYSGGAFCLANAFEWGVGVGEREGVPARRVDLARGLEHRPVREADRVALRTVDWVRDWIDHPRRDAFWKSIVPELPPSPPPVLSIAGAYDFFLPCQLRDHAALVRADAERRAPAPRLVLGPWAHGIPARLRWWRQGLLGHALRESIAHFDVHVRGLPAPAPRGAVRYFLPGPDAWREAPAWPPPGATPRRLYLAPPASGEGRTADRIGALVPDEPQDAATTLSFRSDPEQPLPTLGGALFGFKAGIKDQRALEARPDLLVYESAPLERPLTLAGPVRLRVHGACDAEDADWTARLIDVPPKGRAENVCDGIVRARWRDAEDSQASERFVEPGIVHRLTIELGDAVRCIGAGHRIRLVVGGASFPRFDRNPGSRSTPALAGPDDFRAVAQVVHHEAERRSWLELCAFDGSS